MQLTQALLALALMASQTATTPEPVRVTVAGMNQEQWDAAVEDHCGAYVDEGGLCRAAQRLPPGRQVYLATQNVDDYFREIVEQTYSENGHAQFGRDKLAEIIAEDGEELVHTSHFLKFKNGESHMYVRLDCRDKERQIITYLLDISW